MGLVSQRMEALKNTSTSASLFAALGISHSASCASRGAPISAPSNARRQDNDGVEKVPRDKGAIGHIKLVRGAIGVSHAVFVSDVGACYVVGCGQGLLGLGEGVDCAHTLRPLVLTDASRGAQCAVDVAAGPTHTAIACASGLVLTFGAGANGRLGHGDCEARFVPTVVESLASGGHEIASVACGGSHSLAVSRGGSLFAWGCGHRGRLGTGRSRDELLPRRVEGALSSASVVSVSAGVDYSVAVCADGLCVSFGCGDECGQLGNGTTERDALEPTPLVWLDPKRAVAVACGDGHACVLTDDGRVLTFGDGAEGALGHGLGPSRYQWADQPQPLEVRGVQGVAAVACGEAHALLCVQNDGGAALVCVGNGSNVPKSLLVPAEKSSQIFPVPTCARTCAALCDGRLVAFNADSSAENGVCDISVISLCAESDGAVSSSMSGVECAWTVVDAQSTKPSSAGVGGRATGYIDDSNANFSAEVPAAVTGNVGVTRESKSCRIL